MTFSALELLEEFVEAAQLGCNPEREPWTEAGGLEAARAAYRARHAERGLCKWCTRPAVPNRRGTKLTTYCAVHRDAQIRAARASQARRRSA